MRVRPVLAVLLAGVVVAGCGGGGARPNLTVSAAASLKSAFAAYAAGFHSASVRVAFGGSDVLAAQIRQGARPDVYAAANAKLPDLSAREQLTLAPLVVAALWIGLYPKPIFDVLRAPSENIVRAVGGKTMPAPALASASAAAGATAGDSGAGTRDAGAGQPR